MHTHRQVQFLITCATGWSGVWFLFISFSLQFVSRTFILHSFLYLPFSLGLRLRLRLVSKIGRIVLWLILCSTKFCFRSHFKLLADSPYNWCWTKFPFLLSFGSFFLLLLPLFLLLLISQAQTEKKCVRLSAIQGPRAAIKYFFHLGFGCNNNSLSNTKFVDLMIRPFKRIW